ncbi:arachidonate 5-lipoxygenase-activating protein isoform X3 [Neophocaena asiaeorientalis asiaeorientalis]|uniref:Arachidonate 5-lipoxygenase-activating protein n=2 Tax=Phocoenidae TaxID=9740 RepID=A0A341C8M7_NEOAA|nr:arachidonate 5-lipoxygenase-activating protein isoform X3 [Neophocaena asiaeorientalis asiaeorientalis]XP_032467259.1 arachidonate 5-lipoxygenase-activating protein isoform X3 [Phocoena sinus]
MDYETLGNVVLLAIVTLISVVQNGFFAHKLEHESKTHNGWSFQRTGTLAFERVYTANQNCVDAYPTFLVTLWSAGLLCSQVPAAFAGLMYLVVRQKYFVGYLGERTQSTRGYIFGKRIILFLFLMSLAGILNYFLILLFGSDFENYMKTIANTISPLLLIP